MRRDKVEIAKDVLELCVVPRKITEIMRLANVQYTSFLQYVEPLVNGGYLVEVPSDWGNKKKQWMTTANGRVLCADIASVLSKMGGCYNR